MKRFKAAFTLSEILIALAIIGVLTAILIPMIYRIIPNKNVLMAKRSYYTMQKVIHEMINDASCYPDLTRSSGSKMRVGFDDNKGYKSCTGWNDSSSGSANEKFATLFSMRIGGSNVSISYGNSHFPFQSVFIPAAYALCMPQASVPECERLYGSAGQGYYWTRDGLGDCVKKSDGCPKEDDEEKCIDGYHQNEYGNCCPSVPDECGSDKKWDEITCNCVNKTVDKPDHDFLCAEPLSGCPEGQTWDVKTCECSLDKFINICEKQGKVWDPDTKDCVNPPDPCVVNPESCAGGTSVEEEDDTPINPADVSDTDDDDDDSTSSADDGSSIVGTVYKFSTNDGIDWNIARSGFHAGANDPIEIVVDVNGANKGDNCGQSTAAGVCASGITNYDKYAVRVYANGKIEILDDWVKDAVSVDKNVTGNN